MAFYGAILDTVGIEYESIALTRNFLETVWYPKFKRSFKSLDCQIQITHDASTEFNASYLTTQYGSIPVSQHTELYSQYVWPMQDMKTFGYELVTSPMEIPDLEKVIHPMITSLVNEGDFCSYRSSVHFHIGFGNNLRILQNMLGISLELDPVLYRLGGMGKVFRGFINNSAYARPLTNSSAVPVEGYRQTARVINPKVALNATSLKEFWAAFGVDYKTGGASSKYHPCRYSGINFYSVPQHQTIEFRHMNQTHDSFAIMATAKFLRGAVELATLINRKELSRFEIVPANKEISLQDALHIIHHVYSLCKSYDIANLPTDYEVAYLLSIIEKSHVAEIPETPVMTHLREDYILPASLLQFGKQELVKNVLPPKFVDIHNIKYISLFDDDILNSMDNSTTFNATINEDAEEHLDDEENFDEVNNEEEDD